MPLSLVQSYQSNVHVYTKLVHIVESRLLCNKQNSQLIIEAVLKIEIDCKTRNLKIREITDKR